MRFPRTLGIIDLKKTEEMIMRSIELGVNYFDTAYVYPGSEEALGTILDRNKAREKVFIATKLPLVMIRNPADIDRYYNQHFDRLKTNYIDYYLLHMLTDMEQWAKLKSWGIEEWIEQKKKSGQIKRIGFSFHGSQKEFLSIIGDYDWELSQIQYNYSDENFQAGVTGLRAAAKKMPVVAMEPLLGGKLATGLPKEAVKVFQNANAELSPVGWALNWLWNQEEVTVVLSGMSGMAQLEENALLADKARAGMAGEAEKAAYAEAFVLVNRASKVRCTGCNYCMPCPKGVNIPGCFSAYNASYSIGFTAGMHQFFTSVGMTSEKGGAPSQCVKCGKCESHCPQKIPIMQELVKVRRRMEPFWVRFIGVCARFVLGKKRQAA
jgi:predicted aldo/keto reductase-like oxidoreductase